MYFVQSPRPRLPLIISVSPCLTIRRAERNAKGLEYLIAVEIVGATGILPGAMPTLAVHHVDGTRT